MQSSVFQTDIDTASSRIYSVSEQKRGLKYTTHNGRFGASGGSFSSYREWVTSSFALVRAFAIPPPAAKPQDVIGKRLTVQRTFDNLK